MSTKKPAAAPAKPAAAAAADQTLPQKFNNLFKQVVRCYEQKQYKKGLKSAEQVLKKYPNHGETLAMKGLILNCIDGKKAEAEDYIRVGLKNNIKSHVCWHVYGLLHRSNRNYAEAIKCYLNALRIDVDNQQILKDLSLLQVQMRDMSGFAETRRKILVLKSNNKGNWFAYAIGQHLAGDYKQALELLQSYEKTVEPSKDQFDYEQSEMYLYKNLVIEESGDLEGALKDLDDIDKFVCDKLGLKEKKASLLLRLGKLEEAQQLYSHLIDINPDCLDYHRGLHSALGWTVPLNEAQVKHFVELYSDLKAKHPKVNQIDRIPLDFLGGQGFAERVESYLIKRLRKGIPSLFRDLRPLYANSQKKAVIDGLVKKFLGNLRAVSKFSVTDEAEEAPSALLWTLLYAAHHFDFLRQPQDALAVIDEAIAHTPTSMDLYLEKARIFKHGGDHTRAYIWADQARSLDLADRYLNTVCVKYAWRAHEVQKAEQTAGLFLKDGDRLVSLFEMQAMWYEWAAGKAYLQMEQYGKALKKLTAIQKHYEDMHEDQFDFHTYCLRKMTLRAYVDCLRFEDTIRDHKFFRRASKTVVEIYLKLEDNKNLLLPPDESPKKVVQSGKKEDLDPEGNTFLRTTDPLAEAVKHIKLMEMYCPKYIFAQSLAVEVYSRKGKYLLALRAIKRGLKIDPSSPALHLSIVKFFLQYKQADVHPLTRAAVDEEVKESILPEGSLDSFVGAFQNKARTFTELITAAKVVLLVSSKQAAKAADLILSGDPRSEGTTLQECLDALDFLKNVLHLEVASQQFIAKVAPVFPLSPVFNAARVDPDPQDVEDQKEDGPPS
eukprot:TRINITY_DN5816_c0_g1_i4.p1 TRINITY_DN5816_c0_g1~~TRINITY_DN5816_c0_g1_i4.p1  ORF type:complete len:831 (-),score=257.18 TRINITY_DN5816_c0_g1_i4:88-2580(-)